MLLFPLREGGVLTVSQKVLNSFSRPAISRMVLGVPAGLLLIAAVFGALDPDTPGTIGDLGFWMLVVPAGFFVLRSFILGLRYRNGKFIYRTVFRRRVIAREDIAYFQIIDTADDWPEIFLGVIGEFTSVPGIYLKSGEKISLRVCSSWMPTIDRKILRINKLVNPSCEPQDYEGGEGMSDWAVLVSEFGKKHNKRPQ